MSIEYCFGIHLSRLLKYSLLNRLNKTQQKELANTLQNDCLNSSLTFARKYGAILTFGSSLPMRTVLSGQTFTMELILKPTKLWYGQYLLRWLFVLTKIICERYSYFCPLSFLQITVSISTWSAKNVHYCTNSENPNG